MKAESLAVDKRGKYLSIFDVNHKKAPTLAEITLRLSDENEDLTNAASVVDWVSDGIKAQNNQFVHNLVPFPISHSYTI